MAGCNPRRSNGWARDSLVKRKKALGDPCHLCGHSIDYSLPWSDRRSFVLDELVPISRGGRSEWDNTAAAHRCCNSWRSDKPLTSALRSQIRARYELEVIGARRTSGGATEPVRAEGEASKTSRRWGVF